MNKQYGFINMDFTEFFVQLIVVGIGIGVILCQGVPWLWSIIKPIIHALTA